MLSLAVPTPAAFDVTLTEPHSESEALFGRQNSRVPRPEDVIGHIIHLNDGKLLETGKYLTPLSTIQETADFLADETATAKRGYKHLLLYAHGGLNNRATSAKRVLKMQEVYKRNGIYPFHFMREIGFFETLKDIIFTSKSKVEARVGGLSDIFIECLILWPVDLAQSCGGI